VSDPYDGRPRGPRVKPTLSTAGDVAYSEKLRERAREQLRDLLERRQRLAEIEAHMQHVRDVEWAAEWIERHGGSVPAALKRTHPDTGGNARDFALTQRARQILSADAQR
jgi:hypothetical protein